MRLSFHCTVPGPVEAVYTHVTAVSAEGPVDAALFAQKYGDTLEAAAGDAYVAVTRPGAGDDAPTWRCSFAFPHLRTIEAIDAPDADREDTFESVRGGTRWTVTFLPKSSGLQAWVQWLYFQAVGKYRVGVPVLSPVVQRFRALARDGADASDEGGDAADAEAEQRRD